MLKGDRMNLNALYRNGLYYSESANIIENEILKRSKTKDFKKFEKEDVGLFMPVTTLLSFSCELFLKLIILIDSNQINLKGHNLKILYNKMSEERKSDITQIMLKRNPDFNKEKMEMSINEIAHLFVESRYIHEKCNIIVSYEFLKEFRSSLIEICSNLMK